MTWRPDETDRRTCRVALLWIARHRELHRQPPSAAIARALNNMAAGGHGGERVSENWLTTAEVADRLACSTRHARRLAQRLGTRVGRQWLIPAELLED